MKLNMQFSIGGTVWEGPGGMTKEVYSQDRLWVSKGFCHSQNAFFLCLLLEIKMWALSYSVCHTFAPPSQTQTLSNYKPNLMFSFISCFGCGILSQQQKRNYNTWFMCCWKLNPGFQVCLASTIPTIPSARSKVKSYFWYISVVSILEIMALKKEGEVCWVWAAFSYY